MGLNEADFSDKAARPAHQPHSTVTGKGKAPARSVTALELSKTLNLRIPTFGL